MVIVIITLYSKELLSRGLPSGIIDRYMGQLLSGTFISMFAYSVFIWFMIDYTVDEFTRYSHVGLSLVLIGLYFHIKFFRLAFST